MTAKTYECIPLLWIIENSIKRLLYLLDPLRETYGKYVHESDQMHWIFTNYMKYLYLVLAFLLFNFVTQENIYHRSFGLKIFFRRISFEIKGCAYKIHDLIFYIQKPILFRGTPYAVDVILLKAQANLLSKILLPKIKS